VLAALVGIALSPEEKKRLRTKAHGEVKESETEILERRRYNEK
jgi:hypothetical protein